MKGLFKNSMALLLAGAMVLSDAGISTLASQVSPDAAVVSEESTEVVETETETETDAETAEETVSTEEATEEAIETLDNETSAGETDAETPALDTKTETLDEEEVTGESTEEALEEETDEKLDEAPKAPEGYTDVTNSVEWEKRAMGQSVDLNFSSTILPEKVGTQTAEKTQITVGSETKDALVMESRGGKIASGHDGMTFYFAKLPVDKDFFFQTKVFINQFGPEDGSTPGGQEAVGILVRDAVSANRQEPMLDGYEEQVSCSNQVGALIMSNSKAHDTVLNVQAYNRNGVTSLDGTPNSENNKTKITTLKERGGDASDETAKTVTSEIDVDESGFFTLTMEKTSEGIVCTYTSADGTSSSKTIGDPGRLKVIDNEYMYVGFVASRNAKVTYTDYALYTKDGTCPDSTYVAKGFGADLIDYSNAYTDSTEGYNLVLRPSYDGTISVKNGDQEVTTVEAKEGEDAKIPVTLSDGTNTFTSTLTVTADGTTKDVSTTVEVTPEKYQKTDLYVSPEGTSEGAGTKESPLDIDTALNYVSDGYTVYAAEGTYGALNIKSSMSASSADARKTLKAEGDVIFSGNSYLNANYWTLDGVKITGSNSSGLRVQTGNGCIIQNCEFYGNEDTGCQIGFGEGKPWGLFPKDNLVQYCYSHDNVDASGINADGFAAKLGVGTGNVFRYCEAGNNADDGWDLFNKQGSVKNDPVTIEYCIAHDNGNNGFKLGGEGMAVDHEISYSIAYHNGLDGFTCNFNTGALTVTNNTSFDNMRYNYIFRINPYREPEDSGFFNNNISFRSDSYEPTLNASGNIYNDSIYSTNQSNDYFYKDGNAGITAADFESITPPEVKFDRNEDGTFILDGFMQPTNDSVLATAADGDYVGAVAPKTKTIQAEEITLNKSSVTIKKIGSTVTLKATVKPENVDQPIVWTSSKESVATVNSKGVVKAVKNGTATITATCGTVSATCKVTVSQKVDSVSITLKGQKLSGTIPAQKGKSYTLKAVVAPSNAASKNAKITWKSSNKKIATVNSKGKVSFKKKTGKVTITATSADGKKASVKFKVQAGTVKVKTLKISGNKTMKVKKKQTLSVTVTPATAKNQKVTWKSSNKSVATVSSKGVVTAKKKGTVTITATAKDGSKKKATIKIKVKK